MEYKVRHSYLQNYRMQRRYERVLVKYTDADSKVNLPAIIRDKAIPDGDVLRIFDITKRDLAFLKNPPKNSFVWDVREGWGLEYVEKPVGPVKFFEGRAVHACARLGDGSLVPIERPKTLDTPPEKLYRAINWDNETRVLFSLKSSFLEKLQTGGIAIIVLIMLFFAFVLVTQ